MHSSSLDFIDKRFNHRDHEVTPGLKLQGICKQVMGGFRKWIDDG